MAGSPRPRFARLLALLLMVGGCAGRRITSGPVQEAEPQPTALPARVRGTLPLDAGPWDVSISSRGLVYVTRPRTDSIARVDLAGDGIAGNFMVGNRPDEVWFNARGTRAYVTNLNDRTVGVIDTRTHTQTATFPVAGGPLRVRLGPGETKLYVTLAHGALAVLDATTGAVETTLGVGTAPNGLALTSTGSRLYVSATEGSITEVNTATTQAVRSLLPGGTPQDLVVGPGDSTLYVAHEAGWVSVVDLRTWKAADSIPLPGAFGLALTPDGRRLWVSSPRLGIVSVIDAGSRAILQMIPTSGTPRHLAVTPDGTTVVVADEQGAVKIIR